MRRLGVALMLVALGGCSLGRAGEAEGVSLKPQFAPVDAGAPSPTVDTTAPSASGSADAAAADQRSTTNTSVAPAASAGAAASATTPGPDSPPVPTTASFTDAKGDLTLSVDRPPAWADIVGATLTRSTEAFELRIALGGEVPATYETERTINLASFYDVNGDGSIDYEVWANLASGGWGGSYFDNTKRGANRINDEALVIQPSGHELIVRFPLTHLAGAQRMQWALASEWGRYEVIGTAAAARDDAPDNDAAAQFPSS